MKTYIRFILLISIPSLLFGCDLLNVNPKGEVMDEDIFRSQSGYEDALYGIYAELGTIEHLYSGYMLWLPEVLSINVRSSEMALQNMSVGVWTKDNAPAVRRGIWASAYTTINHINNILAHIEKGGENEFQETPLFKGEALGLRAMLHFDLLRLYAAPEWAPESVKATAIPYVSKYSFSITKFSSLDEIYEKIIADLKEAERLLAQDEILLPAVRSNGSKGGFSSCRIIHMNLYAVQALLARVYWFRNDLKNAALYAEKVISSNKFSFRDKSAFVQPDNGTLDLKETIFGLYSTVSNINNARAYGLTGTGSTFRLVEDWDNLYNDGSASSGSDYRFSAWFENSTFKYLVNNIFIEGQTSYTGNSIIGINLFRLPEMYYIMAESMLKSNPAEATKYYDQVITTRGLDSFKDAGLTVSQENISKERRKEYFGQGLYWSDMKRLGKDIKATVSITLSGSDYNTYKVPIPVSESENRNE